MIQIGKEEVKLLSFVDNMIVCISDPQNSMRELLQMMSSFSNVTGYKINSKKSVALLYTNDKNAKKEIREVALFTMPQIALNVLG